MRQTLTCHPTVDVKTHIALMNSTDCQVVMHSLPLLHKAEAVLAESPDLRSIAVPDISFWISGEETGVSDSLYPYERTLSDVASDTFCVFHTSGSTGIPKKIVMTQGQVAQNNTIAMQPLDSDFQFKRWSGRRTALLTPLGIAAGLYNAIGLNIAFDMVIVLPVPGYGPIEGLEQVLEYGHVSVAILNPKILSAIVEDQQMLEKLRGLEYLAFIGSQMPRRIGNVIAQYTKPLCIYGSSESNLAPTEICGPNDWDCVRFSSLLPHRFRKVCENNYELVLLRDDRLHAFQGVFKLFTGIKEWPMGDLFEPHVNEPNVWRYVGRVNDLIHSTDGPSFLPVRMEQEITAVPGISSAVVCEQRARGLALVVETEGQIADEMGRVPLLDVMWPAIREANRICPVDATIQRDLVIVGNRHTKPLPRGVKGYPQRAASRELYEEEINQAFEQWMTQTAAAQG